MSKENFINNNDGFQRFCHISLNKHAPPKKKHARGNQMPFFNKELSTAIMTRTKLQNISLNEKSVVDNKLFWKTVKPLLSDKVAGKDITHLIENIELVKTDLETAEVLNNFFSNIVQNLDISRYSNDEPLLRNTNDATLKVILKYRNHSSIIAIQNKCKDKGNFNFIEVDQKQIEKEILKLDVCKASQNSDISINVLKENSYVSRNFLCNSFNNSIKLLTFPEILKHADITPLHKKGKKDIKRNYKPVRILPNLLKIFGKCMFEQISKFFENIFSKYQCGFRNGFSTQQC